jgi:hypothetical protein
MFLKDKQIRTLVVFILSTLFLSEPLCAQDTAEAAQKQKEMPDMPVPGSPVPLPAIQDLIARRLAATLDTDLD